MLSLNEYKVSCCLLPAEESSGLVAGAGLLQKVFVLEGCFCVLATHCHPLSRRKEKASKRKKSLAFGV